MGPAAIQAWCEATRRAPRRGGCPRRRATSQRAGHARRRCRRSQYPRRAPAAPAGVSGPAPEAAWGKPSARAEAPGHAPRTGVERRLGQTDAPEGRPPGRRRPTEGHPSNQSAAPGVGVLGGPAGSKRLRPPRRRQVRRTQRADVRRAEIQQRRTGCAQVSGAGVGLDRPGHVRRERLHVGCPNSMPSMTTVTPSRATSMARARHRSAAPTTRAWWPENRSSTTRPSELGLSKGCGGWPRSSSYHQRAGRPQRARCRAIRWASVDPAPGRPSTRMSAAGQGGRLCPPPGPAWGGHRAPGTWKTTPLLQLVVAGPHLRREGGAQLVRVADGPVAVLLGRLVGAEVLGEDELRAEGLDQGAGVGQVHGAGWGRRRGLDRAQVLQVVWGGRCPRAGTRCAPQGEHVATVLEVGVPVDGEVGVAVQGALGGDGDPAISKATRAGDDEARLGEPELRALDAVGWDDVGAVAERPARMRAVPSPKWSPCPWVTKTTSRTGARSAVGTGEAQAGGAVEVEVEGDQSLPGPEQPAGVADPAQADTVRTAGRSRKVAPISLRSQSRVSNRSSGRGSFLGNPLCAPPPLRAPPRCAFRRPGPAERAVPSLRVARCAPVAASREADASASDSPDSRRRATLLELERQSQRVAAREVYGKPVLARSRRRLTMAM